MSNNAQDNIKGIFLSIFAMFLLVIVDTIGKILIKTIPVYEIMFFRSITGIPIFIAYVYFTSGVKAFKVVNWRFQILRALLGVAAMYSYFNSYKYLPMSEAAGIIFSAPIILTILSVLLLKETVGIHRIVAIIVGFVGVLFIARPQASTLNVYVLFPLAGAFIWSFVVLVVSVLSKTDHANATTMVFSIVASVMSGIAMLVDGVVPVYSSSEIFLLLSIGIFGIFGQVFMIMAVPMCEASAFASTKYISLVFSILAGFTVFGEIPSLVTITGIVLIVLSGLYIVYREKRLKKIHKTPAIRP